LIGGVIDLDLLFQIPQVYARIIGGIEREASLRGQHWWSALGFLRLGDKQHPKVEEGAFT